LTEESSTEGEYVPSPTSSSVSMRWRAQSPNSSPPLAAVPPLRPVTPPQMDMSEQFQYAVSESSSSRRDSDTTKEGYPYIDHSPDSAFDLSAYLDMSSCSIPSSVPQLAYNTCNSMQLYNPAMMGTSHATHQVDTTVSEPSTICDGFLSPWPGSLAAAYHNATIAHKQYEHC
jgi:hypothetical protein